MGHFSKKHASEFFSNRRCENFGLKLRGNIAHGNNPVLTHCACGGAAVFATDDIGRSGLTCVACGTRYALDAQPDKLFNQEQREEPRK